MRSEISKQTKHELLEVLRQRYQQTPKLEKTTILDEFVAIASLSFLLIFMQILNPFGVKALCRAKCYPNS